MSDEPKDEIAFAKEGIISMVKKGQAKTFRNKGPKPYFFRLAEGSLFQFPDAQTSLPKDVCNLKTAKLEPGTKATEFNVVVGEWTWSFCTDAEPESKAWQEAIKKNLGKDAVDFDFSAGAAAKGGKQSLLFRAKKNVMGKAATSALGKKAISKILDEHTVNLLKSVRGIIEKRVNKAAAEECEEIIIKLILKAYFQFDKGSLTKESFQKADKPLRSAFNLLCTLYDYYGRKSSEQLESTANPPFLRVATFFDDVHREMAGVLKPFLSPKNCNNMDMIHRSYGSKEFLMGMWDDTTIEEELEHLVNAMNMYTQFNA